MSEIVEDLIGDFEDVAASHPLLILGQLERVGSTFLLDMYEKDRIVHNEPYKQLIPTEWPIARGYLGKLATIDEFFADKNVGTEHKYWLKNFTLSRYQPNGQVLKETNLYMALPQLLELFPYRSLEVLSRSPLGIVSSFKRNDLYQLWNYEHVRDTLQTQIQQTDDSSRLRRFTEEGDNWQEKLIWLAGLNAVILSQNLAHDDYKITTYDDVIRLSNNNEVAERLDNSIFGTNVHKEYDDFDQRLSSNEIARMVAAAEVCIEYVGQEFDHAERSLFGKIFSKYFSDNLIFESKTESTYTGFGHVNMSTPKEYELTTNYWGELPQAKYLDLLPNQTIEWAEKLITNQEMHVFLNEMLRVGFDPSHNYLLIRDNMPPERGGRLIFNKRHNAFDMVTGFEEHPAYWITWVGAAAFAAWRGSRLPTSTEWLDVYTGHTGILQHNKGNHSYSNDDTIPTGGVIDGMPGDFFGNLRVWCQDWSEFGRLNLSKSAVGISWKNYLHGDYSLLSEKPFLTNSRVIGGRLVRCKTCPSHEADVQIILDTIHESFQKKKNVTIQSAQDTSEFNNYLSRKLKGLSGCIHA